MSDCCLSGGWMSWNRGGVGNLLCPAFQAIYMIKMLCTEQMYFCIFFILSNNCLVYTLIIPEDSSQLQ